MSKLLAFAFFGAAAASNTTSGNGTTVTTAGAGAGENGQGGSDVFTGTSGKNLVEMDVTISLDLGTVVTADQMKAQTDVVSGSDACTNATADTALSVTCDVAAALRGVLDSVPGCSVPKVTVVKVTAASRRRSLTETDTRRLATASLAFENSLEVTDAAMGGFLKQAVGTGGSLDATGFASALNTAFGTKYGTVTASGVVGKVCDGTTCTDAVSATPTPTQIEDSLTPSDAIKTGLGLAAAVVSGLFLF